jgi:hypothetical protein
MVIAFPLSALADTTQNTNASVEFEAGGLTLISTPVLDFGKHTISGIKEDYTATSVSAPIRVSDLRGGNSGWSVVAALSGFSDGSVGTLAGSYITLDNLTIFALNGTLSGAPTQASDSIKLTSDAAAVEVLTAAAEKGNGVWEVALPEADTKLTVFPGTASVGIHDASINWELRNTP